MKGNVKDIYTIFDGTDKELIIPVYQRNYDWGENSVSDFMTTWSTSSRKTDRSTFSAQSSVNPKPVSPG